MSKGRFIVFDGIDGAGKTEMSKAAAAHAGALWTRDPGGAPFAELIRSLALGAEAQHADAEVMFALFWAARRDHVVNTIAPALESGRNVISDRFDSSTVAYQIYGQEQKQLMPLFEQMRKHYLAPAAPEHYIILDLEPRVGLERAKNRGGDYNHFDERSLAFHTRVRAGLLEFARTTPSTIIDASRSKEEVWEDVKKAVESLL